MLLSHPMRAGLGPLTITCRRLAKVAVVVVRCFSRPPHLAYCKVCIPSQHSEICSDTCPRSSCGTVRCQHKIPPTGYFSNCLAWTAVAADVREQETMLTELLD